MLVLTVLSLCHFLPTDVIETMILGCSLNLNPFVMVVALTCQSRADRGAGHGAADNRPRLGDFRIRAVKK